MTAASPSPTAVRTSTEAPRRAATRSAVGALRVRRRTARILPALATLAAAGALTFSTPKPAEAMGPIMDMCVDLVDQWHSDCSGGAGNRFQSFACDWVAGVGYIGCGIIGAGELRWPALI